MAFDLADGINWYVAFLFSISCHEAAHAWAASRLGDDTAKLAGQVTLNPVPHVKRAPFGTVVVPLVSYFLTGSVIGWAHAPYNSEWARRYPVRCALMAMAGPAANLGIALVALLLIRVGCEWHVLRIHDHAPLSQMIRAVESAGLGSFFAQILSITYRLNILLGVFNLLPLPPLDGSKIPLFFLPGGAAEKYWFLLSHPSASLLGTYVAWQVFGMISPSVFQIAALILRAFTHL